MRRLAALPLIALATAAPAQTRGEKWWHHVEVIAADDKQGRAIGTPGYDAAADYVIARFKALKLVPGGPNGQWKAPVGFVRQQVTSVAATLDGVALNVPDEATFSARGGPAPEHVSAPLVFAGYGLRIPEANWDDFKGLDLRGKIVVVIAGGPAEVSGALKSDARSDRGKWLAERGALGLIALTPPAQVEIPWDRSKLRSTEPAMYLADNGLRDLGTPFLGGAFNPAVSEKLFAGSGHSFAEVAALSDASKPIPNFALKGTITVDIKATRTNVPGYNIVAKLPGSDPKLKAEHVVLSAHLDGLGVGAPMNGDAIYNGALDDASGVATLIEIAAKIRADKAKPKRSLLFTIVTGEEQGLLGSHAFAKKPSVDPKSIVADLNFDMPLQLWKLDSVVVLGAEQSSLGKDAAAIAAAQGLRLVPDPLPDRNSFTRSDQYSFIREGYPSVAYKFGFARGTPQEVTERTWRSVRYHSPSDDIAQPVEKEEAVKLNDFVAAMALRIADAPERPTWNADSYFKRFVKP